MSPEKDAYLCDKYPKIFVNRNAGVDESCMAWGLAIDDGWFHIIDNACNLIQGHIDWRNQQREKDIKYNEAVDKALAGDMADLYKALFIGNPENLTDWQQDNINKALAGNKRKVSEPIPQFVAEQVKEKFGTLRFYYSGGNEYTSGVANMAEAMSSSICEVCGKPGKTGGKGWIRTTCEEHSK